jgi:parvulin-like peptidyl-prolyl isomerase
MDYPVAEGTGGFSVSLPQYYQWMYNSNYVAGGGTLSREQARQYLDTMLVDTLDNIRADKLNLRAHRRYYRTYLLRYHTLLQTTFLKQKIIPQLEIDSQKVADYYQEHSDAYFLPEQVLIHHILISPEAMAAGPDSTYYKESPPEVLADSARTLAFRCYSLIVDSGKTFTEAALKYSQDSDIKLTGGFLGWTIRNYYEPPFDSVAFNLGKDGISKPYVNENGWHILWAEDYFEGGLRPLKDSLYNVVLNDLLTEELAIRGDKMRDSLSYDLDLQYHDDIMDTNTFKVDDWEWAGILNEQDTIFFYQLKAREQLFRTVYEVGSTTVPMKREMVRLAAEDIRFIQAAKDMGIDTLPQVAAGERELRQKYAKACVQASMQDPEWTPPESAITAYYQEHLDDFVIQKPLKVQQILVADSAVGEFVADQARAGVDFLSLAQQFYVGDVDMRMELANLGYIGKDDVPLEFWKAANDLVPGDVSDPVRTKLGLHVIKLLDANYTPTLDKARSQIIKVLRDEHALKVVDKYRRDLYDEFGIKIVGDIPEIHLKPLRLRKEGA